MCCCNCGSYCLNDCGGYDSDERPVFRYLVEYQGLDLDCISPSGTLHYDGGPLGAASPLKLEYGYYTFGLRYRLNNSSSTITNQCCELHAFTCDNQGPFLRNSSLNANLSIMDDSYTGPSPTDCSTPPLYAFGRDKYTYNCSSGYFTRNTVFFNSSSDIPCGTAVVPTLECVGSGSQSYCTTRSPFGNITPFVDCPIYCNCFPEDYNKSITITLANLCGPLSVLNGPRTVYPTQTFYTPPSTACTGYNPISPYPIESLAGPPSGIFGAGCVGANISWTSECPSGTPFSSNLRCGNPQVIAGETATLTNLHTCKSIQVSIGGIVRGGKPPCWPPVPPPLGNPDCNGANDWYHIYTLSATLQCSGNAIHSPSPVSMSATSYNCTFGCCQVIPGGCVSCGFSCTGVDITVQCHE